VLPPGSCSAEVLAAVAQCGSGLPYWRGEFHRKLPDGAPARPRGFDSDFNDLAIHPDNFHNDPAINDDGFVSFARENEHKLRSPEAESI